MNISEIIEFLKQLAANNNRIWFQEHKAEYLHVQEMFNELLAALIARIAVFDKSVAHVRPQDCTYRIYRDIRFSSDKSPYERHIGGYINAKGKKSNHCGYYIHLEPGNCMLAGGSWCLPANVLKAVRQSVYDNIDEFRAIVEAPAFRRYFPVIGEEHLKTLPKGFPKDFPYPQYLCCKDYSVSYRVSDNFFEVPDFLEQTAEVFRQMKPFADFTNFTIDDFE